MHAGKVTRNYTSSVCMKSSKEEVSVFVKKVTRKSASVFARKVARN